MPLFDFECEQCGRVNEILFFSNEEQKANCDLCSAPMRKLMPLVNTPEWGGPRWDDAQQTTFSSRGEKDAYYKGLGYEPAGDKVGGARNEDHLHLGKRIVSDPKVKSRKTSSFAF